jgi:DNA-binding winged helix-turn-helix (wHTH) protein/class 3 adenylate cyclase
MVRPSDPPAIIEFGHFSILSHRRQLLANGQPIRLGGRAFDLLLALLETPGAVIGKDELLSRIWPGRIVEENRLQSEIWALRKALGVDRDLIQTVAGRGYQFTGEIHELATGVNARQVAAPLAVPASPSRATNPSDYVSEPIGREAMLSKVTDHVTQVARQSPRESAEGARVLKHDAAERRQITAMLCEATGLAVRADGIGLEDLAEGIGAFQRSVSEIVGRHSGFVASSLGNSVLVLFGYPAAHEHDAERAIRAGLELCAAVRSLRSDADVPMQCRIGIATGMVIVGDLAGAGQVWEHGAVGDAPALAARLQLSAQSDTVTIDPSTWRLIGNLFDCRDLGLLDTNSDTEPIRRWRVLGESLVASRFEALRGSKLTPLVGRDEEIDLLLRRWARAKSGDGQIMLVSGEAGLGKSRITAELEERLHTEPHLCLRYFCSPYHQDSALFPIIAQLGRAAGFARNDPPASKLEKLEALLASTAPPDEDVAFLADLMSLPASEGRPLPNLTPQRKKEKTLEALIGQLDTRSRWSQYGRMRIGSTPAPGSCST